MEKHIVKPIVLRELRENHEYNWRINDSIDDINLFMKWNIASKREYSIGSKYIDHDT